MNEFRKKLYDIIEPRTKASKLSNIYDVSMIVIILLSFLPLMFRVESPPLRVIDIICVVIFCIDYVLRWMTADFRFEKAGASSFARYPFSLMAIIDLLTILPSVIALNTAFRALRIMRLLRALRVLRVTKIVRYSKSAQMLKDVFYTQRYPLLVVMLLTAGYVFFSALVLFQVEPETFEDFIDAMYWSMVSLTTIGYGDIVPATDIGRVFTMISAMMGIAVVAIPAGIITAGYMDEIQKVRKNKDDNEDE